MKKTTKGFLALALVLILETWIAYLHWSLVRCPALGFAWVITFGVTFLGGLAIVAGELG